MLKKMMFPTDFSIASDKIYNCIPTLKTLGMKEALLVHIVDKRDDKSVPERTKWAEDALGRYKEQFKAKGIKVKTIVKLGVPFIELNNIAEKEKVSLVVITSHGESMIEKMLLGSVTEKFVYHCKRPVLIEKVKIFEPYKQKICSDVIFKNTFKHVLYPTDWSKCANDVLEKLKNFKKFGTEAITVLHVMDNRLLKNYDIEKRKELEKADLKRLGAAAKKLKKLGFAVETKLTRGIPFREIKRAARENEITLIAMGVHGKGFVKEVMLGSTAERTAKYAFKPVLLLSHKED
jgi:nucleotide-binding universal stress UspA family protein